MQEIKCPQVSILQDLPESVILNILSRLPVKTLCKFKCVCKDWLTWISSDSYFKNFQCFQSLKFPSLISYDVKGLDAFEKRMYCTICVSSTDMKSGKVKDKWEVKISRNLSGNPFCQVTSCRNLICIFSDLEIVVCNPGNREFLTVSGHGNNSPNSVGIGYIASSTEYRVVRLHNTIIDGTERLGCKIFSLKDSCDYYTESSTYFDGFQFKPSQFRPIDECLPICVNGIMYWMLKYSNDDNKLAYYLDLEQVSFGTVGCPKLDVQEKILLSYADMKFVKVHGLLCLECCLPLTSSISLYALKDIIHGEWEKLLMISLINIVPGIGRCRVLGFIGLDQFVIAKISIDNKAGPYYICSTVKDKTFKKVEFQEQNNDNFGILHFDGLFSFKRNDKSV